MKIHFVRSGGFAGLATNVEGEITFDKDRARVSAPCGYQRQLDAPQAQRLRSAAEPSRIAAAQSAAGAATSQARDAYQYDITVSTSDGKSHKLTVTDADDLKARVPDVGELVQKIQDEVQMIWSHRTAK